MAIFRQKDAKVLYAQDGTILREIFHPAHTGINTSYSLAHARLLPGELSTQHSLNKSSELYYILKGDGMMHIDEEVSRVTKDNVVFIPAGSQQWIENSGDEELIFLCIVSPPWQSEDDEVCVNP